MRFFKKYLPNHDSIKKEVRSRWLKKWLYSHPQLWHFNRHSVARGLSVGLFAAILPLPIQMLLATILAIMVRGNIPIAILATWITNPFTMLPVLYLIYKIGSWVTEEEASISQFKEFHWSDVGSINLFWHNFITWASSLGKSFFIGLPIVAIGVAVLGYFLVYVIWRIYISVQWIYRRRRRK